MGESAISAPRSGSEVMAVTVRLPGALRDVTGGETKLTASGATLREVIADIDRRHPGFAARVLDPSGGIRAYVKVYIGEEDAGARGGRHASGHEGREGTGIPTSAGGRRSTAPVPAILAT